MTQSDLLPAFRVLLQQKNNTTSTGKTIMKIFLGRFETFVVDGLKDRDHLLQITKFGASRF